MLLLSPTVHPWYFLWVLPWLALGSPWGWLALTATVPLYVGLLGSSPGRGFGRWMVESAAWRPARDSGGAGVGGRGATGSYDPENRNNQRKKRMIQRLFHGLGGDDWRSRPPPPSWRHRSRPLADGDGRREPGRLDAGLDLPLAALEQDGHLLAV
jgi:hypothetical protein